ASSRRGCSPARPIASSPSGTPSRIDSKNFRLSIDDCRLGDWRGELAPTTSMGNPLNKSTIRQSTIENWRMSVVSRFAPAPTGHLHLGHVVNAVFVWGLTRALGGRVLLRVEDHDRARSRAEFDRSIIRDLEWLGFVADGPIVRQSDRGALYET